MNLSSFAAIRFNEKQTASNKINTFCFMTFIINRILVICCKCMKKTRKFQIIIQKNMK